MSPAVVLARARRRILLPFAVGLNAVSIAALLWLDAQKSLALKYNGEGSDAPSNGGSNKTPDSSKASVEAGGLNNATKVHEKDLTNADANSNLPVNGVDSGSVKPPAGDTNASFKAHGVPIVGSSAYPQILAGPIPSELIIHDTNDGSSGNKLIADSAAAGSLLISESNWIILSGAVSNPAGALQIDTTAPTVTSVVSSGPGIDGSGNGDLNAGHVVTLTVNMSEAVTVAGGTPTLSLSNGGTASYTGGTGTALTFSYTVGAGQDTGDLAVTSFNLNGATLQDAANNNAVLSGAVSNPAGALQIDTTAPTVTSITSIALGGVGGNHWVITGTAEANSNVAIFDGVTQLSTVTASVSGSWSYTTTGSVTNSSAHTFTANASDAAGNTSAFLAAWIEGASGNDTFAFASEASLVAPGAVSGNGGADTISMIAAVTLNSGDFANVTSVQTLQLTGANTITLGADAAAAGIVNVVTGTGATSVTDSNGVTLNVNATALANNTALTLVGSAAEVVTGLVGDIAAGSLTGALTVTTGDAADNGISITTGSAATSITDAFNTDTVTVNATALAQNTALTLTGSAAEVVTGLVGDIAAGSLTGALTVTTGDAADNGISITTGSAATSITDAFNTDTVTVNATALTANTLTLSGSAAATVTLGTGGNLAAGTDTGNLTVNGGSANNTITTGSGNDTIKGGAGADLLTGGAGSDKFVFTAASDSTVASHDSIADFVHGVDIIDTSAITGLTIVGGLITGSAQVPANGIVWIQSGSDTIVYANTSGVAENQGSADMEIVLTNVVASTLTSADFFHF
ncbi:beta strand repeat-containing protein [Bradyrhizobium sp.]|uniref:beta strand repeat-containing protein n=1 Tax=Bradyrhizobium sp. TaxID=376 RepID=UPI003C74081C